MAKVVSYSQARRLQKQGDGYIIYYGKEAGQDSWWYTEDYQLAIDLILPLVGEDRKLAEFAEAACNGRRISRQFCQRIVQGRTP